MTVDRRWPTGLAAGPIEPADVGAWAELLMAKEKVDQEGQSHAIEDLLEELADPARDVAFDTVGLWSGDQMVGYGMLRPPSHQLVDILEVYARGTIHPQWRRRGLGKALVAWMIQRSTELHRAWQTGTTSELNTDALTTDIGAEALLTGYGFRKCRHFLDMDCPLDTPPDQAPLPDQMRIIAYAPEYDEALRLLHNEAFRDHWGSSPTNTRNWRLWVTGSRAFVRSASYLIFDGDELVAYALGYEHWSREVSGIPEIHVRQVGTARSHRGRGLATAALSRLMAEAQRAGFQRALLTVDAESLTGAVRLYERLGFRTTRVSASYSRPIPGTDQQDAARPARTIKPAG